MESVEEAAYYGIRDLKDASCYGEGIADHAVLKGSATCVRQEVDFRNYISLSHLNRSNLDSIKFNVIFDKESDNLQEIYDKALELNIPREVEETYRDCATDLDIYAEFKSYLTFNNMPYAVIGLGKVKGTGEDAAVLFFAMGVSPKDALAEVQQAVLDHKLPLNLSQSRKLEESFNYRNLVSRACGDIFPRMDPDPIHCS